MHNTEDLLANLEPMFREAEEKKLWFYCSYQSMWFSPQELRERGMKKVVLFGGPDNWRLRNPAELVDYAQREIVNAQNNLRHIQERINKWLSTKS